MKVLSPGVLVLSSALILGCGRAPGGVTSGRLRLRTFPPGARVWIDGELRVDATPATLILKAGRHRLRIQAEGAEPLLEDIAIDRGEATELNLDIPRPADASISVLSDVVGAQVRINGWVRGETPLAGAITRPGPFDLTLVSPEGRARSIRGQLAIGEQKRLQVFFEAAESDPDDATPEVPPRMCLPRPRGWLTLGLNPDGEVFTDDGAPLGRTPIVKKAIEPGEHALLLRSLDGRYERRVAVEVAEDRVAIYRFAFSPSDQVPGWSRAR